MSIRIVIVDSHRLVLDAMQSMLDLFDDLELVGRAEDGETALALCFETQPDMVITEIRTLVVDGITLTQQLLEKSPHVKVIALDIYQIPADIEAILYAGAVTYLNKASNGIDDLAQAIRAVAQGNPPPPQYDPSELS